MAASLKGIGFTGIAAFLRPYRLALWSLGSLTLGLLIGSSVLPQASRELAAVLPHSDNAQPASTKGPSADGAPTSQFSSSRSSPSQPSSSQSAWAGKLETPVDAQAPRSEAPLTSASYTSGFDKDAAGLGPLPPAAPPERSIVANDPHSCPDDLNCAFRPHADSVAGAPVRRKPPMPIVMAKAAPAAPASGFAGFAANLHLPTQLPLAGTLLKPFGYVGDRVTDFVKKL